MGNRRATPTPGKEIIGSPSVNGPTVTAPSGLVLNTSPPSTYFILDIDAGALKDVQHEVPRAYK